MFRNYFTVALRNLWRHPLYVFLNVFGLALGTTCCVLVFLFLQFEWSHDEFHENADNIYRLLVRRITPEGDVRFSRLHSTSIVEPLKEEHTVLSHVTEYMQATIPVSYANSTHMISTGVVDNDFLEMFTFPIVAGDPSKALSNPQDVVLSEEIVRFLFGGDTANEEAIGQVLRIPVSEDPFVVTGVMKDTPENSSLRFKMLISRAHGAAVPNNSDNNGNQAIFVMLAPGKDAEDLASNFPAFVKKHLNHVLERTKGIWCADDLEESYQLVLQPLHDIYLNEGLTAPLDHGYVGSGDHRDGYVLATIASLVLVLACVNFTSLSLSLAVERSSEIGVRKVLGSSRVQLICQFCGEALLLGGAGLAVGIALAELFLPTFMGMADRPLGLSYLEFPQTVLFVVSVFFVVGLVAGSYPALVLSGSEPMVSLSGKSPGGNRRTLTKALVVFQYAASIVLLVGTAIVSQQVRYMQEKELGYEDTDVVVVSLPFDGGSTRVAELFIERINNLEGIEATTASDRSFTHGASATGVRREDGAMVDVRFIRAAPDYLETLGIELSDGRDFSYTNSESAVIVNETLVRAFGWENPLGQEFGAGLGSISNTTVVGVVEDFHFDSLHSEIEPLALYIQPTGNPLNSVFVRIRAGDARETLTQLEDTFREVASDLDFNHSFLDDNLDRQYRNEQNFIRILGYAAGLALLITSLGLLGQTSLSVVQRTKEIGVRKVLGATAGTIVSMLSKEFLLLTSFATAISWAVAYLVASEWLKIFPYRIDIGPGAFLLGAAAALALGWLSVSYMTIRASTRNPVDALRYE